MLRPAWSDGETIGRSDLQSQYPQQEHWSQHQPLLQIVKEELFRVEMDRESDGSLVRYVGADLWGWVAIESESMPNLKDADGSRLLQNQS